MEVDGSLRLGQTGLSLTSTVAAQVCVRRDDEDDEDDDDDDDDDEYDDDEDDDKNDDRCGSMKQSRSADSCWASLDTDWR